MTKHQILARNMGLRIVMLENSPGWSIRLAKELAEMSTAHWSHYRRGVYPYITDRALERIGRALGMRTVDLLGTPGRVIATAVPAEWLAPECEESPQPVERAP